jgi:arginyl-tRNA synthetase
MLFSASYFMKNTVEQILQESLVILQNKSLLLKEAISDFKVERSKDQNHGDYASNIALTLAKQNKISPRQVAELIVNHLPIHSSIAKVEIAGPGFINFFLKSAQRSQIISSVLELKEKFGCSAIGENKKVILEYVSANPTGPLHVGHGRSAAFGASLANLLKVVGYNVSREYYVNDAGRQMDILAVSVWLRYLALAGETIIFPDNGYQGDYVIEIARGLVQKHARDFVHSWAVLKEGLPLDESAGGDKELYIDAIIAKARLLMGEAGFELFHQAALQIVLEDIKLDLAEFGVDYEQWFSEKSLLNDGSIAQGINALKEAGFTYEKGNALWFKSTDFGDEKDRVLVRANGVHTYFASDVAYHWNKYNRGFDRVIDIFGADHHGYFTRVKAAVNALGHDDNALSVLFVQFAILYRAGKRVQMSTRSGSFVTLRELREEVGNDAARFFYVMRKPEQHMDFDLDLAKSKSNENPVYYIQYAHARICSVFRQMQERGLTWDEKIGLENTEKLSESHESQLISLVSMYPEVIESAARTMEPHQLAYYLRELANGLHSYYNAITLLCDQDNLRLARLCLLKSVRQILSNGLQILGVSAPESM